MKPTRLVHQNSQSACRMTVLFAGSLTVLILISTFLLWDAAVEASANGSIEVPQGGLTLGNPMAVTVEASAPPEKRVRHATAFTDCCVLCEEQTLEALVPTSAGPQRKETDGGLPLRRQFCGTVTRYGVNDELADPRDIMINIAPAAPAPFPDFVAGFVNTEETPLSGSDRQKFGPRVLPGGVISTAHWNLTDCLNRAREIPAKVIHAEITPDQDFYGQDRRFLPIRGSGSCSDDWDCSSELEPGTGRPGKELCVYGVYAIDHGGHSAASHTLLCCSLDPGHDRPEIHPFDAVWWRHPEANGWMFAMFQDDSNRYSFPHCGDHNGNEWSQAPRDLTFRFPFQFRFLNAPRQAVLQHVITRNFNNAQNTVRPKNVITSIFVNPGPQVTSLIIGGRRVLDVVKEAGTEQETQIQVQGRMVKNMVSGQIIVRVAIGCDDRNSPCVKPTGPRDHRTPIYDRLQPLNSKVVYDRSDPGAGYYYAELIFR